MTKKAYKAPTIRELGSFESMTKGASSSPLLDNAQQAGTVPVPGFEFS